MTTRINLSQTTSFGLPDAVHVGVDALQKLGTECREIGATNILVITDKGLVAAGIAEKVCDELDKSKFRFAVFDEVEPSPHTTTIGRCDELVRREKYDVLIGLGGGSSMDVAKAASILATNGGAIGDYAGFNRVGKPGIPKILIPTTAGSGSEASKGCLFTDDEDGLKKAVISRHMLGDAAIIDPVLTLSLPRVVTVDTGIDALIHAIEGYVSPAACPVTDSMALEAIRLISDNLRKVFAYGNNIKARYAMSVASFLAGTAIMAGLGCVHVLAYPLSTRHHMTHRRSNAVMLPHVMEFNRIADLNKFKAIAKAMGENVAGLTISDASMKAIDAVKKLLSDLEVSYKIRDYCITDDVAPMAIEAMESGARLLPTNPRTISNDEAINIFKKAW